MADVKELIRTALDREEGSFRRRMAVLDLAKAEDPAVIDTLVQLMKDEDQYMRREVVSALAKRPEAAAVDSLIMLLGDDDDTVQRHAADALGERTVVAAIGSLEAIADDNSYSVRDAVKRAIERIKRKHPDAGTEPSPAARPAASVSPVAITPAPPIVSPPVTPAPAAVIKPVTASPPASTPYPVPPTPSPEPELVEAEIVFVEPPIQEKALAESIDQPSVEIAPAAELAADIPESPEVDAVPAELVSVVPAGKLPWDRAIRMRIFFAEQLPKAQKLYDAITACRERQLQGEGKHYQALMTLGVERADKEDDLARLQEATESVQQRLHELQQKSTGKLREKHRLKQEADNVWNQMSMSIFPDRKTELNQQLRRLDAELAGLRDKIDEAREELMSLEQQHQQLAGPMAELRDSVEQLTKDRHSATQRLVKLERKLEKLVLQLFRGLDDDERQARRDRLADLSTHGDFLNACMEQLQASLDRLSVEAAEMKRTEAALEQAKAAGRSGLEAVGEAVSAGFQISATEKETAVRLTGSIRFQEEHSFLGGYSGASGSARGTGSGHAVYMVEQVEWRPSNEIHQHVQALTDAWSICGEQSARLEILSALRTVRRRHISEYVHFLRTELECDFQQESR